MCMSPAHVVHTARPGICLVWIKLAYLPAGFQVQLKASDVGHQHLAAGCINLQSTLQCMSSVIWHDCFEEMSDGMAIVFAVQSGG